MDRETARTWKYQIILLRYTWRINDMDKKVINYNVGKKTYNVISNRPSEEAIKRFLNKVLKLV